MGTLTLYAISLEDVRQWFGAPQPWSTTLLEDAEKVAHEQAKPALIGRIGPLFKHPVAPIMELPGPTMGDANALVEGRAIAADRLGPAWVIVRHWCDSTSFGSVAITLEQQQLALLDFTLVSGGLSSQFSLETIIARDPHLPLLPAPGMSVGWMPGDHAVRAASQWGAAVQSAALREDIRESADAVHGFFQLPDWTQPSDEALPPDVLALYQ
ncbi:MAG: hypothetical protein FWD80_06955 [Propionibacteriaceae bacterium]|nr:hypothetical protein [Propionibacteriaceae bacterium]